MRDIHIFRQTQMGERMLWIRSDARMVVDNLNIHLLQVPLEMSATSTTQNYANIKCFPALLPYFRHQTARHGQILSKTVPSRPQLRSLPKKVVWLSLTPGAPIQPTKSWGHRLSQFAAFWSWKLPFQRNCDWNSNLSFSTVFLQHFGAQTVHVGFKVCLGLF